MQNHSSDGATLRARLNELPALIDAAIKRGDKHAATILRTERGYLEDMVPILEREAKARYCRELQIQIALGEKNLLETEAALRLAAQTNQAALEAFNSQAPPVVEALRLGKHKAAVQMISVRNALEAQRRSLADLRVALGQHCPEEN